MTWTVDGTAQGSGVEENEPWAVLFYFISGGAQPRLASPTGAVANQLVAWLRGMDALREALAA